MEKSQNIGTKSAFTQKKKEKKEKEKYLIPPFIIYNFWSLLDNFILLS